MSTHKTSSETRMQPLLFSPLTVDGTKFLEWINDVKVVWATKDLAAYLTTETTEGLPDVMKWQTLFILCMYLYHFLWQQYIQIEDLADSWAQLHAKIHHEQTIFLPQVINDLRVLDFSNFPSFNSELHHITAQLRLCGE